MEFFRRLINAFSYCNQTPENEEPYYEIDVSKLNPIEKLIYEESGIFKLEEYWEELQRKERAYLESMENIKRAKQKNINFHIENASKPEYRVES